MRGFKLGAQRTRITLSASLLKLIQKRGYKKSSPSFRNLLRNLVTSDFLIQAGYIPYFQEIGLALYSGCS